MGLRMATYLMIDLLPKHSNIWGSPAQRADGRPSSNGASWSNFFQTRFVCHE
jgi:hypothetical protein